MRKYAKALTNIIIALVVLLALIFILPKLLVFFLPFVIGGIVALIASPVVRFFEEKLKLKRKIGGAFVIVAVIALIALAAYFLIAQLVLQILSFAEAAPTLWPAIEAEISNIGKSVNTFLAKIPGNLDLNLNRIGMKASELVSNLIAGSGTPTLEIAGNIAKSLPGIFIGVIMSLLSAYFFLADRDDLYRWCRKYVPLSVQARFQIVVDSIYKSVGGYFKAQLKIEIWIYLMLVLGLFLLGQDYFLIIALGIAFLDFLPVFGSGIILFPWAVVKFFNADYKMTIGLLILWGGAQLVRQLIQPKIVGDSLGVKPLPTLILLYVGYKVNGVLGMLVAVPIGLLFIAMYEEGVFETTKNSVLVLSAGLNRFRKFVPEDLEEMEEQQKRNEALAAEMHQKKLEAEEARRKEKNNRKLLKKKSK